MLLDYILLFNTYHLNLRAQCTLYQGSPTPGLWSIGHWAMWMAGWCGCMCGHCVHPRASPRASWAFASPLAWASPWALRAFMSPCASAHIPIWASAQGPFCTTNGCSCMREQEHICSPPHKTIPFPPPPLLGRQPWKVGELYIF